MSFNFQWPRFSDQFHTDAIQMLDSALNKGNKPPVIADKIEVVELEMGTQPPELEIRDIGELTMNQFRGIFRLTYEGDAHIVLRTKVQANPLFHKKPDIHQMGGSRGMLAANQPLVVPMLLRLSNFKLNSYVVLVVSKPKGITLVFKTDPLQNVDIHSTFDSINVIQKFIQKEIEGQLRQMFREDLPGIIHKLSQQWIKSTTVEAPYLRPPVRQRATRETMSNPDSSGTRMSMSARIPPLAQSHLSFGGPPSRRGRRLSTSATSTGTINDLPWQGEYFGSASDFPLVPDRRAFPDLRRFMHESHGLAELSEEQSEVDEIDESGSFDVIDWDDTMTDIHVPQRVNVTEYETFPAIGGGVITRPRVYHSSSLPHESAGPSTQGRQQSYSSPISPTSEQSRHSSLYHQPRSRQTRSTFGSRTESWDSASAVNLDQDAYPWDVASRSATNRSNRRANLEDDPEVTFGTNERAYAGAGREYEDSVSSSDPSSSAVQLDSRSTSAYERSRRDSISSRTMPPASSFSDDEGDVDSEHKIVLRPGLHNTVSQLGILSRSNHTLSPYTRTLEHFTTRSAPPRTVLAPATAQPTERQPVKAKRRRTYRLGGPSAKSVGETHKSTELASPSHASSTPPDVDPADISLYFRSRDEVSSCTSSPHFSHIRQRSSYKSF